MLATEKTTPLQPLLVLAAETRTPAALDVVGERTLVKVSGADTNGQFAIFHLTVPPMSGPPLHSHTREEEWFYILNGEITYEIDGKRAMAGPGACVLAPRGTIHAFQNFGTTTAHLLVMVVPAGVDRFFEELSASTPAGELPDPAFLGGLAQQYGIAILGPPLAA